MSEFFVNCDWGSTRLRLRLASVAGARIAAEYASDEGVSNIASRAAAADRPTAFHAVLANGLRALEESIGRPIGAAPVVISGMASSSIGWHDLRYAVVPWRLDGADSIWRELEPLADDGQSRRVLLLSGVRTERDIMRGEEAQALGLFQIESVRPFVERAIVILPGTHSKHLQVAAGAITDFRTFMTGELYDVLGRHSILRHSIGPAQMVADDLPAEDFASFVDGVRQGCDEPLSATLFQVRARQVLEEMPLAANRAFLSGVLIGGELAYLRDGDQGAPMILCASAPATPRYAAAIGALGLTTRLITIEPSQVDRLSALGQAVIARRLGLG